MASTATGTRKRVSVPTPGCNLLVSASVTMGRPGARRLGDRKPCSVPPCALRSIVLMMIACSADSKDDARHVASAACSLKSPGDWQEFLETTSDDETWVKTCSSDGNCAESFGAFSAHVQTDVLDVFESCTKDISDNPVIAQCTERLRRFIPAWMRQHASGSYGFAEDNAPYLAAQTGPDTPAGMMEPPAEILAALPERAQIEQAARDNGWRFLTHDSGLGGVRTFVVVADPSDRFDQWFVVSLDAAATRVGENRVMSFIAVQKKDADGRSFERTRLHFRDYIMWPSGTSWQLMLPELHEAKCYACHVSGVRQLLPTHENVVASAPVKGEDGFSGADVSEEFGFQRLSELNQRLLSYGLPDWNGVIEPENQGPPLGASLGCPSCHNGLIRGALSVFTDEKTVERKMVDELSMRSSTDGASVPDDAAITLLDRESTGMPPLTAEETEALENARAEHRRDHATFVAERFPTWRAWVLEEPCE